MKEYLEYSLDYWGEIPVVEEHYMNKLIKLNQDSQKFITEEAAGTPLPAGSLVKLNLHSHQRSSPYISGLRIDTSPLFLA